MDATQHDADERFRAEIRGWLEENLTGRFAALRGRGGSGREHEDFEARLEWNRHLAAAGWTCVGWPVEHGGRGLSIAQQVIIHEEYARADAPARVNHLGEELLGPTLIAHGTPAQQARFLPRIVAVEELWCQGYSEPGAGSDLAAVATKAQRTGDEWSVTGPKVWTSLAQQIAFRRELDAVIETAQRTGAIDDAVIRDRLVRARMDLEVIRQHALRTLGGAQGDGASVAKLLWSNWHRALGELAMEVAGPEALRVGADYALDDLQTLFLFSRADTIYGGSDEIQRTVIAERVLGLPREARP